MGMHNDVMAALGEKLFGEATKKAALTTADFTTATLANEQADVFIDQVIDESTLLKMVRVHKTSVPSGDIAKLRITGPVTEKATENNDSGNTAKPTNSVVSYTTVKSRSAIDISGEVQEDTIEGGGVKATIMGAMVKQIANDMETLAIEGDDTTAGSTAAALLLKTNDGWHVQTTGASSATDLTHTVAAGGKRPSWALLNDMMRQMPTKYRKDKSALRWIMSVNAAQDLKEEWATRSTDLGDRIRSSMDLPPIAGVQVMEVPLLPEDLTVSGTDSNAGSFIWLADPKNFIYVVQRALTIEWQRVPRSDKDEGTVHMRTDFIIEETDAIVKATGINLDPTTTLYGAS